MADFIGNIEVPTIANTGTFPLTGTNYTWNRTESRKVAIHTFLLADGKTEQRYLLGYEGRTFTFRKERMCEEERLELINFWELNLGAYGIFNYNVPDDNNNTFTTVVVRFKDDNLTLDGVIGLILTVGITFVEVVDALTTPVHPYNGTVVRWPAAVHGTGDANALALAAQLLQPVQEMIPLYIIQPREMVSTTSGSAPYPTIYISDRRCQIGTQVYLARVLKRGPITLALNGESPPFNFTLGNADEVITDLTNDTDIKRADVQFSLYETATGLIWNVWRGYIVDWNTDEGPEATITAAEGVYELTLSYPQGLITQTCYRDFDNPNTGCPFSTQSTGVINGADPTFCDKGFATANGCLNLGMAPFFGGIQTNPETIRSVDNTTGIFGFGRRTLTTTSQVSASFYGEVLPEIYCDYSTNPDPTFGLTINCLLMAGIDEGDFYNGLGIVGAGPIGDYSDWDSSYSPFLIDGQPNHGWPNNQDGLIRSLGSNPATNNDPDGGSAWFSLTVLESVNGQPAVELPTSNTQSGGLAWCQIRRADTKGTTIDTLASHSMQVNVRVGLGGYIWYAPGNNSFQTSGMNEPVWVMLNAYLKCLSLWGAPPSVTVPVTEQEVYVDPVSAIYTATQICDIIVPVLIGGNPGDTEIQYLFTGVFQNQLSLKDWLVQAANTFLGYFAFDFGQLRVGAKENASVVSAYTIGNVKMQSCEFTPISSNFNRIQGTYAEELYGFVSNTVNIYDEIQAQWLGTVANPKYLPVDLNFVGVTRMSQCARLITTRLREEICGYGYATRTDFFGNIDPLATFKYGRNVKMSSTLLSLENGPGDVVSLEIDQCPNYPPLSPDDTVINPLNFTAKGYPMYIKFRIKEMVINPDYSVDISGPAVHDDTYSLVGGPKPLDVLPTPLPIPNQNAPANWRFDVQALQDGLLRFINFSCGTNSASVHLGLFTIYCIDETQNFFSMMVGGSPPLGTSNAQIFFTGNVTTDATISVTVDGTTFATWLAATNGITGASSISDVVTSLAAWLNGLGPFAPFVAEAVGQQLTIIDPTSTAITASVAITGNNGNGLVASISQFGSIVGLGTPPTVGQWIIVDGELMLVTTVTMTAGPNSWNATVNRAQLGTLLVDHPRINTTISAVDPTCSSIITIDPGLNIRPGTLLNSPIGTPNEQVQVEAYDPNTGICVLALPFPTTTTGDPIFQDPRIWRVEQLNHILSFPPRFFQSPQRSIYQDILPLPMLGVVAVTGVLQNTLGLNSNTLILYPVSSTTLSPVPAVDESGWPYSVRTLGTHRYTFQQDNVATGTITDLFAGIPVAETQSFQFAQVTVTNGPGVPIDTPPAVTSLVKTAVVPTGLLIISGAPELNMQVQVIIKPNTSNSLGNNTASAVWRGNDFGIDGTSSLADVMASLAAWINDPATNAVFSQFYTAAVSTVDYSSPPIPPPPSIIPPLGSNIITLADNLAYGGVISIGQYPPVIPLPVPAPQIPAATYSFAVSGFTSQLGIMSGRRYAVAFLDSGNGWRSDLSIPSQSTGATGDATIINIQDIPTSSDGRVDTIEIYASPDGVNDVNGPWYLLGTVGNGTNNFRDTQPEASLASGTPYPGITQPSASGDLLVIVTKNGNPWFQMYVPVDTNTSVAANGFALDPVSQDVVINCNVVNNIAGVSIYVELQ